MAASSSGEAPSTSDGSNSFFSTTLIVAWLLSAGVFDAGEADPQRASRLRLSFRESAALASTMLYVLTGLAAYVMAEQGDPGSAVDMPAALKAAREGKHLHGRKPRKTD